MAELATLEGSGEITLDDLFDVNDYLGVKYFGADLWNRIKDYACRLTECAMKNPTAFCIHNIKYRHTPSRDSIELMGFNDHMGVCAMGSTAWGMLKSRIDDEVLCGWNPIKAVVSKVSEGLDYIGDKLSDAASYVTGKPASYAVKAAKFLDPTNLIEYAANETPLQYTGWGIIDAAKDATTQPFTDVAYDGIQDSVDAVNKVLYDIGTKTPLKSIPTVQLYTKAIAQANEKAGITSPGTSDVYESEDEYVQRMVQSHAAAARAASAASKDQAHDITVANKKKEVAEKQAELDHSNKLLTSKYMPIILAGSFGLIALSMFKK